MIYCEKPEFGQISRSLSLNSGAIRLKRSKNLTQIGFLSLRSVKPDRLLEKSVCIKDGIENAACSGSVELPSCYLREEEDRSAT
jgi:hypothetical protein